MLPAVRNRDHAISQAVIDAAPAGYVYLHLTWFQRRPSRWLGEWAGYVPAPDLPPMITGAARGRALNVWTQAVQAGVSPSRVMWPTIEQVWDAAAWGACPAGGAVCLDVTRFHWPVGDHCWHAWNETSQGLDWPVEHKFIEVHVGRREIIANQSSHRPLRDAVSGQRVIDITGTALEPYHGRLLGQVDDWRRLIGAGPLALLEDVHG